MWLKTKINTLYLCYLNWRLRRKFCFPPASYQTIFFYHYCKDIANEKTVDTIEHYEEKLMTFAQRYDKTRKEIAQMLVNVYSDLYKELN